MLSPEERDLLFQYCWGHVVARCPKCGSAYRMQDLGADLTRQQSTFCSLCRISLVRSIRAHLASCTALRVRAAAIRGRARDAHDEAVTLRKQSEQASDRADILDAEADAAEDEAARFRRQRPGPAEGT